MIERLLAAEAALDRAELDVAGRLFGQVADADPRNAIAVVGLARLALRRGAREEARDLARRALDIDPDEAAAQRLLAELDALVQDEVPVPAEPRAQPEQAAPAPRRSWWRRLLAGILGRG
jgi:tetratricopeptide (TPR) repeat protein